MNLLIDSLNNYCLLTLYCLFYFKIDAEEKIDVKVPMARLDGHNLLVKLKGVCLDALLLLLKTCQIYVPIVL